MAGGAQNPAEELAELCAKLRGETASGGRLLHDGAGPLLTAAGLRLGLLRMDHPAAESEINKIVALLQEAMASVREVSQQLIPSPATRTGLKPALAALAEADSRIQISYPSSAKVPAAPATTLYDAATAVIAAAFRAQASRIRVAVTGASILSIRIADDGRKPGRAQSLAVPTLLAQAAGASVKLTTKKDTIVLIRYDLRRSIGG